MFGFLKKDSQGNIEKEFEWMTLERICRDLDQGVLDANKVVSGLCRLAMYGGINYKNTLYKKSVFKTFASDKVIVEGVGFVWSCIYNESLRSDKNNIYEDEQLADGIYFGSGGLHHLLSQLVEFELKPNFSSKYQSTNLVEKTEKLVGYVLHALDIDTMSDVQKSLHIQTLTNVFVTSMIPALTEASSNAISIYMESC